jgi:hypothetical protein
MKKLASLVTGLAAAPLLCVAYILPCQATTATTAYVSGGGLDTNACTLAAPCKTINHATTIAGDGGAVSCLDAGPYTESLATATSYTVDCRGVVYAASGLVVDSVQGTGAVVTFRHVIFDGAAGGIGAVLISGGAKVIFEDCTFQNFTASPGVAIKFEPSSAGAHLTITDSVFASNGLAASGGGIVIAPSGGVTASVVIERTQLAGNTYGIAAVGIGGTVLVEVRSSTIASSVFDGIQAVTTGPVASIVLEHSASVQNGGNGIYAQGASAYVSLRDSTVDWNSTGLATSSGGTILSYQNNLIAGNLHPGVTPVSLSQQ